MPEKISILRGSEHIVLDSDQPVETTAPILANLISALAVIRDLVQDVKDITITRLDPGGVFSYKLTTGPTPVREYCQEWFFDLPDIRVTFQTVTGTWHIPELTANIKLREAAQSLHAAVGLDKLTCNW